MKHTFYLKEPKAKNKSLIYFSCYFNKEKRKFVYSTGEKIRPKHWSKENNAPKMKGSVKDENASSIKMQLDRYTNAFETVRTQQQLLKEDFTSKNLKTYLNHEFKKVDKKATSFFEVYDAFMVDRQMQKVWSKATIKRYKNIKTHLENFESDKKYKLTFSTITDEFYTKILDYFYTDKEHFSNTVVRNIGLFKTFMNWSLEKKHTYKSDFKKFKKPKTVITETIALNIQQVEDIFKLEIENEALEKVRDVFVFQCLTGLRYGEMKAINKRTVSGNYITLKEEKDSSKESRKIPLMAISNYILKKYNYRLPLISNQKQNKYIKEVLKDAEYTKETEYTRVRGVEITTFAEPLYKRISTHTARRTFITILKNKGIPDKAIAEITGHTDLKTLNQYYKTDDETSLKAVVDVFGKIELPKLKAI